MDCKLILGSVKAILFCLMARKINLNITKKSITTPSENFQSLESKLISPALKIYQKYYICYQLNCKAYFSLCGPAEIAAHWCLLFTSDMQVAERWMNAAPLFLWHNPYIINFCCCCSKAVKQMLFWTENHHFDTNRHSPWATQSTN